jgi:NTE family protein
MLFHVGALWRLNDAGLLPRLKRVSTVSGGSLTAGVLAKHWRDLRFDGAGTSADFTDVVAARLMKFATKGVDVRAVVTGGFVPGPIGNRVASLYRRRLFGATTLGDLPDEAESPEFVFTATNLSTGALWYYSKSVVGDHVGGVFKAPGVQLATAVAASSAFPPVLSPHIVDHSSHSKAKGAQGKVRLSDGGVYDNLGLQPLEDRTGRHGIRLLLASDGGQPFKPKAKPPRTWLLGTVHVLKVVDYQVRKLRRSDLVADFGAGRRRGTYWGIDSDLADYTNNSRRGNPMTPEDLLPVARERAQALARGSTRLKALPEPLQRDLVNWGYAVADTALRKYVMPLPRGSFPFGATLG